jgi:hypothetical protein
MEHGFMTFADAVECGPDIIEVPMIETPEMSVEKKWTEGNSFRRACVPPPI